MAEKQLKDPGELGIYIEGLTVRWAYCIANVLTIRFTNGVNLVLEAEDQRDFLDGVYVIYKSEGRTY